MAWENHTKKGHKTAILSSQELSICTYLELNLTSDIKKKIWGCQRDVIREVYIVAKSVSGTSC